MSTTNLAGEFRHLPKISERLRDFATLDFHGGSSWRLQSDIEPHGQLNESKSSAPAIVLLVQMFGRVPRISLDVLIYFTSTPQSRSPIEVLPL